MTTISGLFPSRRLLTFFTTINQSNIRPSEHKAADIQALKDYIALVMENEKDGSQCDTQQFICFT
jgi:hypothetical protein